VTLAVIGRFAMAAAFALGASAPHDDAVAGTASASFEVHAQLVFNGGSQCRIAAQPVSLSCGSPQAPTILQPRPEHTGVTLEDGWITYGNRTEVYDSVYAASLTTRVIRYEQWEYIETLVSW
jgi:hypothetical protein